MAIIICREPGDYQSAISFQSALSGSSAASRGDECYAQASFKPGLPITVELMSGAQQRHWDVGLDRCSERSGEHLRGEHLPRALHGTLLLLLLPS